MVNRPINVILIQTDSLNRHYLPTYGNSWVETPNLSRFADQSIVFDQHYLGSTPSMPARREIWTGTQEFWWRGWGSLETWDLTLPYLMRHGKEPITAHLVTDHYHFFEWGSHSYNYDYHGYEFIRGHEFDNWRSDRPTITPAWAKKMLAVRGDSAQIYIQNVQGFHTEADFFAPQVMQTAANWIKNWHGTNPFFLHIDSFDVHEPFHIPEPYRSMYTDEDYRYHNPWPLYGRIDSGESELSSQELAWVQAQYAGKITMFDVWLGKLLDELDKKKLWKDTCVILTTDHGHFLGDHGWVGKPAAPMYDTLSHIPLMVWHPDSSLNGSHVQAITQTVDLYATILSIMGITIPQEKFIHSRSFYSVMMGEETSHRQIAVYGYHNKRVGITDGEWTLLRFHDPDAAPAYLYTHDVRHSDSFGFLKRENRRFQWDEIEGGNFLPGVPYPVWRVLMPEDWAKTQPKPWDDLLFHTQTDPNQTMDLAITKPEVVKRLEIMLRDHMQSIEAPREQFLRLKLVDDQG